MAAEHQSAYRKRLAEKGRQEITVVVSNATADALRQVAKDHGQTQGRVLELGIAAADNLLAGRLQVGKVVPPGPRSARTIIMQRAAAPSQSTDNANAPATPENAPTPPLCEPEQVADDNVDARIRAAASMES